MRCEFKTAADTTCERCKSGRQVCIVEGRKARTAPKYVFCLFPHGAFFHLFPRVRCSFIDVCSCLCAVVSTDLPSNAPLSLFLLVACFNAFAFALPSYFRFHARSGLQILWFLSPSHHHHARLFRALSYMIFSGLGGSIQSHLGGVGRPSCICGAMQRRTSPRCIDGTSSSAVFTSVSLALLSSSLRLRRGVAF